MSDLNKREIIAELKALRDNIQNFEAAQQNLQSCEAKLKEAEEISTSTYYNKYPTDNYQTEHKKYIFENKKRKETKKRVFFTVTIAILVAMIALWLCMSGIFTKNTYLYTPEILKEYSGTYEADHIPALDVHLSIISCEENGTFQGMFEFSGYENLLNSDIHGKFSVTGQIQTKSREGHVNATLSFNEWLEKAAGRARMLESEFKEIPIKISNNCQIIKGLTSDLHVCSSDYKPQASTDLNTPEIINTYSGEFDPGIGYLSTATISIESCDESGKVMGTFEYSFKEGFFQGDDKWKIEGQIIEKYDDGTVKIQFVPIESIYNNYDLYDAETMIVEIYDNYRSLISDEGMYWFYEDEGFKKNPDPVVTPIQNAFRISALIVFPIYIALIIIVYIIILRQKTDVFTDTQKRRLDELSAQDAANRQKNQKAANIARAERSKYKQSQIAKCTSDVNQATQRVAMYANECAKITILSDEDKTIDNVEFLIHKLESGRADTLKEALHLLDEDVIRRKERNARAFWEFQESQRRAQEAANARLDQMYHNMNVEYEQRRQTRELEKIRESLEDK